MKKILILFAAMAALSCGHSSDIMVSDATIIKVPLSTSDNVINISDIVDSIHYIKLQTSPDCLIGQIDNIIPTKDGIIVVDKEVARSVFLFDKKGTFIRKIGKLGEGPQEVSNISTVFVDQKNERVFIYDHTKKKILTYSFYAEFLESYPLDVFMYQAEYLGDDKIAIYRKYSYDERLKEKSILPNLLIYDLKKGKIDGRYCYYDQGLKSTYLINMLSYLKLYDENSAQLFLPTSDTIFSINKNSVQPKYVFDFGADNSKVLRDYVQDLIDTKPNIGKVGEKYINTQAVLLEGYAETDATMFIMYKKADMYYMSFYNKTSGNVIEGSRQNARMSIKDDLDNMLFFFPMGADDNYFYLQVDIADLMSLSNDKLSQRTSHLQSISTDNDNPIIAAVKIKKF